MKNVILLMSILLTSSFLMSQELSPYFKFADSDKEITALSGEVKQILTKAGFNIIGEYAPGKSDSLYVICFTSQELKDLSLEFDDRGALASVLKVGLVRTAGKTTISMLNPEYMFLAYWGKQLDGQENKLMSVSEKAKAALTNFGEPVAFGGSVKKKNLPGYHYMMMMPYFDDPDELNEFDSFEQGMATITKNLKAGKGNTVLVYKQVFKGKEIAVFGVGLMNEEDGEPAFLPVIGAEHIANMPYEIILQGKVATALPGKYRIALFWPSLTMGTFMKINSTPGNIKDALEAVTQ